ncbi:MAG: FKBP-type peptidyl-prolyl cis-trans isomerase [Actinomycetia bacterium]|nr:FKBP-type peptidyl-prolyl cis-trans isomerase [Actinomycetes bacterium]
MKHRIMILVATLTTLALVVALAGCGGGSSAAPVDKVQIKDTKVGTGEVAKEGDTITVNYTLWLYTDGKKGEKIQSSLDSGQPVSLQLNESNVIKGWVQGIPGMKIGGTRTLIIPPALGYGDQEVGNGQIPANSTLFFEVELLSIEKLEIKDTKVGEGAEVKAGDTVTVNYTGWLYVDGKKTTQFDTSIGKQPFTTQIGAGKVIQGWDQGIVGMKVGGTRTLIIPPALGYGAQGSPPSIPANSTLYFEVELISIN